mmetsp:Transcript_123805/g.213902  ORF Transcript_123805/g.213902 Transcript_123805/m.213902 type:complete len:334 (-) Transcript_123805:113-1114(-)
MARPKESSEKKEESKEEKKSKSKEEPQEKKTESKGDKKKETPAANGEKRGLLSAIRPRQRSIFLVIFLGFCIWILAFHDQCDIKQKKREDCGYMGISAIECRTIGCFKKGGGELKKISVTVKREKGTKYGILVGKITKKEWLTIDEIKEGAIQAHNDALPAGDEKRVEVGDSIVKIDGIGTNKGMKKILSKADTDKMELEIRRSKLPKLLRSLVHQRGNPNRLETFLTAPGLEKFLASFANMGAAGFGAWILSGYSPASLPLYYFTPSALVAWHMTKCCHNQEVAGGVPHCYKGRSDTPREAFRRMWEATQQAYANFRKDPKKWSMSLVKPKL